MGAKEARNRPLSRPAACNACGARAITGHGRAPPARRPSAVLSVLPAAVAVVGFAVPPARAAAPVWEPSPLHVAHGDIVDAGDRTVLLRGVNVNQLADHAVGDPGLPTVVPLTRGDFAEMASLGFTVVRLNVSWSALEPRPGAFDAGYAARIRDTVRAAAGHGMYTVVDMHQDAWGKAVGTPPGTSCPPPLERARGWDGAPAWATLTGGLTTCTVGGVREASARSCAAAAWCSPRTCRTSRSRWTGRGR
ncbi:cellulase family glycosylhydrolase [Actinomadura bangladeshensis]|uniref:Glycoside hydrolase family 5 protein n=1 Tax=Actinomadura bangladeshensis TaxID=453573 RepID=A0A6L9Q6D0_9ACTN|nr:cellulase family glycosylhydrolase [Actinomadura bangladeshensis]NEA21080.1 glycoside hydrolase family 5 protein [Actinomadura bangladeshensis]